jgi:hypothetical protein
VTFSIFLYLPLSKAQIFSLTPCINAKILTFPYCQRPSIMPGKKEKSQFCIIYSQVLDRELKQKENRRKHFLNFSGSSKLRRVHYFYGKHISSPLSAYIKHIMQKRYD